MRADRLVSLVLLLQARGRVTARALASELEVSVRTVYRDLEALSAMGVPVGLDGAIAAAHRQIRVTSGLGRPSGSSGGDGALVHLDMPRWFRSRERVPHLRDLATALRRTQRVRFRYQRPGGDPGPASPRRLAW